MREVYCSCHPLGHWLTDRRVELGGASNECPMCHGNRGYVCWIKNLSQHVQEEQTK